MVKKIASFFAFLRIGGGVEQVQSQMSLGLVEKGYDFSHILMEGRSETNEHAGSVIVLDEPFIVGFGPKKIWSLFRMAKRISDISNREKFDVVLGQGDYFYMITGIARKFFGMKAKAVAVVHTTIRIWPAPINFVLRKCLAMNDRIVLTSRSESEMFSNEYWFPEEKLQVIRNSIDPESIHRKKDMPIPEEFRDIFNRKKFTFVNIARVTYQKNQRLLMEAFEALKKSRPEIEIQLVVMGDGDLMEECLRFRDGLASSEDIHFLWTQSNIFPFVMESDCFVLSSRFEGFPMVLLEVAECASCPIISTDCPTGPSELIWKNFLVPNNENPVGALARTMEKAYDDGALRATEISANQSQAKTFHKEAVMESWDSFFRSL